MNNEKKIEIVKRNIGTIKNHLEIPIVDECMDLKEQLKYELSIYERELKILQIEPRTIETLKVGDYIFLQMTQGLVVAVNDYEFEIVTSLGSHENISYHPSLKYKIIPREFLELWGEISG